MDMRATGADIEFMGWDDKPAGLVEVRVLRLNLFALTDRDRRWLLELVALCHRWGEGDDAEREGMLDGNEEESWGLGPAAGRLLAEAAAAHAEQLLAADRARVATLPPARLTMPVADLVVEPEPDHQPEPDQVHTYPDTGGEALPCVNLGCDRVFNTSRGLHRHERSCPHRHEPAPEASGSVPRDEGDETGNGFVGVPCCGRTWRTERTWRTHLINVHDGEEP